MIFSGIDIEVKRSERVKTLSIFVERDGSVSVLAPVSVDDETILQLLASKEYLLHTKISRWKELNSGSIKREFVNGQSFMYLGRNYRLKIVEEQPNDLVFKGNFFLFNRNSLPKAEKIFIDFYKSKGLEKINERLSFYQEKIKANVTDIRVMELKNRWDSCSSNGRLNFHWKVAMAPISVLDYIIVHELVHLLHHNHSAAFWNELDKVLPNYRESEIWLRHHGVKMSL